MWKSLLFNFVLFYAVTYLGEKNHISPLALAALFVAAHYFLGRLINREEFNYMPDSHKTTCPEGSVPAENGLDCKLPTDRYGL